MVLATHCRCHQCKNGKRITGKRLGNGPEPSRKPKPKSSSAEGSGDRPTFYKSIQSVRENGMDMTVWLDYFITGLETQMIEVKKRGEQIIRRDVLVQKHGLNERQGKAIEFLLGCGKLTIQNFENLCPDVNRRSLQRDLKGMLDKELITENGAGPTDPTRHYALLEL